MDMKLNDKIKALNSSRVFKKITPRHDLSWYVKWASSILILLAVASRATGTLPMFDLWFSLIGTVGWFTVGMLWHDRALIMLNGALVMVLVMSVCRMHMATMNM